MKNQRVKLLDGLLTLYTRPGTAVWWAVFWRKNQQIRFSTGKRDLDAARKIAQELFFEKRQQLASGVAPAPKTSSFRHASELALAQYSLDAERGKRSLAYVRGLTRLMKMVNERIGDADITRINQMTWNGLRQSLGALSEKTVHQYRNALQIVLKQAVIRGDLKTMPVFVRETNGNQQSTPRTYFGIEEVKTLAAALRENIAAHKQNGTRWISDAEELRDFVLIDLNTGMRVGELMSVRFCDVTITHEKNSIEEYLEIRNILGKRGRSGICKSFYGAVNSFKRCVARHGLTLENYSASEDLIFRAYHRDAFREILKSVNLYKTNDRPPLKRDMKSLRSSYICIRLMLGVPVYDVANNVRTSVQMIETHYARHLSILSSSTINKRLVQPEGVDDVGVAEDDR
jgi:integrase